MDHPTIYQGTQGADQVFYVNVGATYASILASLFDLLEDYINDAVAYNSAEREAEHVSICSANTREKVLKGVESWAEDIGGHPVCWLYGPAGAGKSTIAQTIAEKYAGRGELAFSYFFSRRNPDRNDLSKFIPTFAWQLAQILPSVQQSMLNTLRDNRSILTQRRDDQFMNLIVKPVQSNLPKPPFLMMVVIDGLDEFNQDERTNLERLIQLLTRYSPSLPFRLFFTSRPEAYIEAIFTQPQLSTITRLVALQDFPAIDGVFNYLNSELSKVGERRQLPPNWLSHANLRHLAQQSEGIYIYASTLIKFVDDEYADPPQRLQIASKAHKGVYSLFEQVLRDAKKYDHFDRVLGAIVFLRDNPAIGILPQLLRLPSVSVVRLALRGCLSILLVPKRDDDYVRPYHASMLDFLKDPDQSQDRFFDPVDCNAVILDACIQLITAGSKHNITCFRYACQNWCYHMHMVLSYVKDVGRIKSNLARVTVFLMDLFPRFKDWMVGLGGIEEAGRVRDALHSLCDIVGQAISDVTCLTRIFNKETIHETCKSCKRTQTSTGGR